VKVLKEISGVVRSVGTETATVALEGGVVVDFPIHLFTEAKACRFGQAVTYAICERANGYRFQEFRIRDVPHLDTENRRKIDSLIEEIRTKLRLKSDDR